MARLVPDENHLPMDEDLDESTLVKRMLSGNEEAFDHFVDHFAPGIFRFAISRLAGDQSLAEDIAQSTMVKARSTSPRPRSKGFGATSARWGWTGQRRLRSACRGRRARF